MPRETLYEGDSKIRHRMAVEVYQLGVETKKLVKEERTWLPIDSAAGLPAEENIEEDAFQAILAEDLSEYLKFLPPRFRRVLEMYHGQELTYTQIGTRMGVTCERVRQIEAQARGNLLSDPGFRRKFKLFLE